MSFVAWLVAAVLLQGLLTLAALGVLSYVRVHFLRVGKVRAADVVLSREPWPDRAKQASNTFDNQFQLPLLFYVGVALAIFFGPNLLEVVLAWVFAVSRWVHAFIYIVWNHVPSRATAFSFGFAALIVLWLDLMVRFIELAPTLG